MTMDVLIACGPGELHGIVAADGTAVELRIERELSGSLLGARFVGRVKTVAPAVAAAFVDIGQEQPAFLPLRRNTPPPSQGAAVAVTVVKDGRETKPPELALCPDQSSVTDTAPVPRRLDPPKSALERLLLSLDGLAVDRVIVNDASAMLEARQILKQLRPDHQPECRFEAGGDLFARHDVEHVFAEAMATTISLENGGALMVERTAVGTMIDVDLARAAGDRRSPAQANLQTNLDAARAVARQLRLRGIGGAVIVDFITLRDRGDRARLLEVLAACVNSDPEPVEIHGWTRLGHVEITRRRRRVSIPEILLEPASSRPTATSVALQTLYTASFAPPRPGPITLRVAPNVAAELNGPLAGFCDLAASRCGRKIIIDGQADQPHDQTTIDGI